MRRMTTTVDQTVIYLLTARPEVRNFGEAVVVVLFVSALIELEMLRRRAGFRARVGAGGVFAIASVLALSWIVITTQRFLDLLF
jgi:hypothetical protein